MGHDKLRKFAENETFSCLVQPSSEELLADGYLALKDHGMKGRWKDFFKNDNPIVLELGCGKGEYTIDLAQRDPSKNYIGVDIKGARLWKGAKCATEHSLSNVAFLRTRIEFICAFFAQDEISEIWLTFSDPQHRRENARLSCPLFLERYKTFLKDGGIVHLKTDSRFLYEYTGAVCADNGLSVLASTVDLYGCGEVEFIEERPELREVQTFYESMFLEQGYKINYLAFCLDKDGKIESPESFDAEYWRSIEGPRQLFGRDTAETRRQKLHSMEK